MSPYIDDRGVPYCSEDWCARYDGKRCRLLGRRPSTVCEPAVVDMAARLHQIGLPTRKTDGTCTVTFDLSNQLQINLLYTVIATLRGRKTGVEND